MLIHERPDGAVCIGQASHGWVSGRLARRWGNDDFAEPDPYEELCLGAEQHDVGMAEWDLHPALNPDTGLPCAFMQMPLATHLELWAAAPRKVLSQSPYAALLISMHGHALYARRDTSDPAIRAFLDDHEALQRDLIAKLQEDPGRARRNQRLLWALDFLSLAPIMRWVPETVPAPTRPDEPDAELSVDLEDDLRLTVDPWPFDAPELSLSYQGRLLTGTHEREADLHAALDAAPWVAVEVTWIRRAG